MQPRITLAEAALFGRLAFLPVENGAYDIGGNAGFGSLLSVRVGEGYETEDFNFWRKSLDRGDS